ncbi:MAG: LolA family protein [Geminicoccaceae bacterium]
MSHARRALRREAGLVRAAACLALLLIGLIAVPLGAAVRDPAAVNEEEIARIEDYLNGLSTLRSKFVQINPDGGMATGQFYYERPDKMRLDYDPPSDLQIIANGWDLVYHDRRLKQVSHLLTSTTPLEFLLQDKIRLSGDVTVTDLARRAGELTVTLVQTDDPNEGRITLAFAEQPMELRRWTVVDAQGQRTQVLLDGLETDVKLDKDLFRFRDLDHLRKRSD